MITDRVELRRAINARSLELFRETGFHPLRVLMSQRQHRVAGDHIVKSMLKEGMEIFCGLEVVICPDCDLYVVPILC